MYPRRWRVVYLPRERPKLFDRRHPAEDNAGNADRQPRDVLVRGPLGQRLPFVVGVGVLSGLLAGMLVLPVALWTDGRFSTPDGPPGGYVSLPAVVGGVGLFASAWIEFVVLRGPPDPGGWLLLRQVLVAGCLAAGTRHLAFRGTEPGHRRSSRPVYAAFVVVWAVVATALYAPL